MLSLCLSQLDFINALTAQFTQSRELREKTQMLYNLHAREYTAKLLSMLTHVVKIQTGYLLEIDWGDEQIMQLVPTQQTQMIVIQANKLYKQVREVLHV